MTGHPFYDHLRRGRDCERPRGAGEASRPDDASRRGEATHPTDGDRPRPVTASTAPTRSGNDDGPAEHAATPDLDPALPILRELEDLVVEAVLADDAARADATSGDQSADADLPTGPLATEADGSPDAAADPDASTTTLPSRSVRLSGTPASRTADAVDGAGWP